MICYMDRAFCSQSMGGDATRCTNTKCSRNFTEEHRANSRKWWGGDGAPISVSPFKTADCGYMAELPTGIANADGRK